MPIASKRWILGTLLTVCVLTATLYLLGSRLNLNDQRQIGEQIDALDGVAIYYNGGVNHVQDRHLSADGYNLGLRYQCVEFVKRYYFEHFHHRMPDSYGHAKDLFDPKVADGSLNPQRGLLQFRNSSHSAPQPGDVVVFAPSLLNRFGHVAIVAQVSGEHIQIAQQNPGPFASSRETIRLNEQNGVWRMEHSRVLGWLRMPPMVDADRVTTPLSPAPEDLSHEPAKAFMAPGAQQDNGLTKKAERVIAPSPSQPRPE
jgi:hypothetical protein